MWQSKVCLSSAVAALFIIFVPMVEGSAITPDSILNPPAAVNSASGTIVPAQQMVTTQYSGLGLSFTATAISQLKGVAVWAPINDAFAVPASQVVGQPPPNPPPPSIGYGMWTGDGQFVVPGTTEKTSVSSFGLEIVGSRGTGVYVFNRQWQTIGFANPVGTGPHGGEIYTYSGGNASAFSIFVPIADGMPYNDYPPWGIAEISFIATPEPSALLLAALGFLAYILSFRLKRVGLSI